MTRSHWGTEAWSVLRLMAPSFIIPLLWPIIGPPMFVRETFTTVPGRFGVARGGPDRSPRSPRLVPPRVIVGTEEGPPTAPTATAAEATGAITAAANVPTKRGRLMAVTSCRPGRPGERLVGPARALGRSARWPAGGRGPPAPTHPYCGWARPR